MDLPRVVVRIAVRTVVGILCGDGSIPGIRGRTYFRSAHKRTAASAAPGNCARLQPRCNPPTPTRVAAVHRSLICLSCRQASAVGPSDPLGMYKSPRVRNLPLVRPRRSLHPGSWTCQSGPWRSDRRCISHRGCGPDARPAYWFPEPHSSLLIY